MGDSERWGHKGPNRGGSTRYTTNLSITERFQRRHKTAHAACTEKLNMRICSLVEHEINQFM